MKINIKDIAAEQAEITFTVPVSQFAFSPDEVILKEEVQIEVKIEKVGHEIFLRGNIKTELELECSRCLKHFLFPVNENFQTIFQPFSPGTGEEEIELMKDELDIEFYKDDIIDLAEIVREQILLSIPMIPICDESCQGLCPRCGKNLNLNKCLCAREPVDLRWSKLHNLGSQKQ